MNDEERTVRDFEREREWAVNLTFVESGCLECIVCLEPVTVYNLGHQRVVRCKNGHQVSVSTVHTNN